MKYVSFDIETTGLDPDQHQILEVAAVLDDTTNPLVPVDELPSISMLVWHDKLEGHPFALNMNHELVKRLAGGEGIRHDEVVRSLTGWLDGLKVERVWPAGKNFGSFDLRFLRRLPNWDLVRMAHRSLDPASLYLLPDDEELPNLETCLLRAGIPKTVSHRALDDARDVVRVLRAAWGRRT